MRIAVDRQFKQTERLGVSRRRRQGYLIGAQIQVVGSEIVCRTIGRTRRFGRL
jgi:hypothetical protein